jgi:hypothetical protein
MHHQVVAIGFDSTIDPTTGLLAPQTASATAYLRIM